METVKKTELRNVFQLCQEYLALESHEYKLLEGEKLATVLQLYGLDRFESEVYYTKFLFIFTSLTDYDNLKFYIKKSKTVFKFELPEYEKCVVALEYFNDSSLPTVLN